MENFEFVSPTKIFFGKNKEDEVGKIISSYGFKKVMIVYGMNSIKKSGLLEKVISKLEENEISYIEFGGVRANPTIQKVIEGVKIAKDNKIEMILAIGGGSVIDTSKSISVGYYYDSNPFDFNLYVARPQKSLPIGCILTISAAGSELSNSCVIQDDVSGMKKGFNSDVIRPLFSIENPELTYSTPRYQTSCGIVDIMMHTLERYFASGVADLSDNIAVGLLKSVYDAGKIVNEDPSNFEGRATLMLASGLSHNGITGLGKNFKFPCHYLEHILSGLYPNIAHGAGLAVIFPYWAEEYVDIDYKKMAKLDNVIFHNHCLDEHEGAKMFILHIKEYFKSLDMPSSFKDLNIAESDINRLVEQFRINGTRVIDHDGKPLTESVAESIFKRCC